MNDEDLAMSIALAVKDEHTQNGKTFDPSIILIVGLILQLIQFLYTIWRQHHNTLIGRIILKRKFRRYLKNNKDVEIFNQYGDSIVKHTLLQINKPC